MTSIPESSSLSEPSTGSPPPRHSSGEKYFQTAHLLGDLRGRSVRGGAHIFGGQLIAFLVQLLGTVVLARLLVPSDFGLIAMVAAFVGFVQMFKDLGLSTATIQNDEINHAQVSTLFWVNVALSFLMVALTAALAPAVAWFYGEPKLVGITLAISVTFIFGGVTVQHQALLRRQMQFGTLAAAAVVSKIVAVSVGILCAWYGAGYWALVAMAAAHPATSAVYVWIACGWRPGPPRRRVGTRSLLAFGGRLSASEFLGYIRRNLDNVLIGAYHGATSLGFYAKAYQLLLLPMNQINKPMKRIALPALSRLQNDPPRYRRFYSRAIALLVTSGMPIVVFAFVHVKAIIATVLGDQWTETVVIFQCLAPAAFIGTLNVAGGWVNISLGRADRLLRAKVLSTSTQVLAILSGLPFGAVGVAVAVSIAEGISRGPILAYQLHGSHVSVADVGRAIWRPAAASCLAGVALFAMLPILQPVDNAPVEMFVGAALYGIFYIVAWLLLPGGRAILLEIVGLVKELRGRSDAKKMPTAQATPAR